MDRESLACIDDMGRHRRVGDARKAIYVGNSAVDGAAVETLLKEDSLVPMAVSVLCHVADHMLIISERVFGQIIAAQLQHIRHACGGPPAQS